MSKLSTLIDALKAVKAKFATEGKTAVHEALQELFEKHPKLESFKWQQYTPYFNDGSPCEFGVHSIDSFTFDGEEDPELFDYSTATRENGYKSARLGSDELHAAYDAINTLSAQLEAAEEVLEAVFGDHVEVTVTRDGISVDEYNHY
jgi:hypothetical protein